MHQNLFRILSNLTRTNAEDTTKNILQTYLEKRSCIVHFLYFATIILNQLDQEKYPQKKEAFLGALRSGDFLLPDGVALQLLYKKHFGKELPNLNGTDFLPYFLRHLPENAKAEVLLYGGSEAVAQKSATHIAETFGYPILSTQHGFQEFDWDYVHPKQEGIIRILLVGRGSPLQETWVEANKQKIESMQCLVFTVGGLLDFWSGAEKRAPDWMRSMRIEWLYRAISNPQKNLRKTLVSLQLVKFLIKK